MAGRADRPDDPRDLPIGNAVERYLRARRADASDSSIQTWRYRLKLFIEWCQTVGVEVTGDLRGYDLVEFNEYRAADIEPATLEGEMWTLRKFCEYMEQLGAVEDDLAESVRIPELDAEDWVDETQLKQENGVPQVRYMREDPEWFGKRSQVLLEMAWFTGARMGGLRALDLRDVDLDIGFVHFQHRPDTGTPLKNKYRGERAVGLTEENVDALDRYIEHHRTDVRDDHGRQPLITSQQGRPSTGTIRDWMYMATVPCIREDCPHGKERPTCEWTEYSHASKCPSSRSPHQVRSGSITWQLNKGIPVEIVAERVNATPDVIERHYDQEGPVERMLQRRQHYLDYLDLEDPSNDHDIL